LRFISNKKRNAKIVLSLSGEVKVKPFGFLKKSPHLRFAAGSIFPKNLDSPPLRCISLFFFIKRRIRLF
jgi:hypothetical protein